MRTINMMRVSDLVVVAAAAARVPVMKLNPKMHPWVIWAPMPTSAYHSGRCSILRWLGRRKPSVIKADPRNNILLVTLRYIVPHLHPQGPAGCLRFPNLGCMTAGRPRVVPKVDCGIQVQTSPTVFHGDVWSTFGSIIITEFIVVGVDLCFDVFSVLFWHGIKEKDLWDL